MTVKQFFQDILKVCLIGWAKIFGITFMSFLIISIFEHRTTTTIEYILFGVGWLLIDLTPSFMKTVWNDCGKKEKKQ